MIWYQLEVEADKWEELQNLLLEIKEKHDKKMCI